MRRRIYKSVVRQIITQQLKRMLNTAEMKIIRKIDNRTFWDMARNMDIGTGARWKTLLTGYKRVEWNDYQTVDGVAKTTHLSVGRP